MSLNEFTFESTSDRRVEGGNKSESLISVKSDKNMADFDDENLDSDVDVETRRQCCGVEPPNTSPQHGAGRCSRVNRIARPTRNGLFITRQVLKSLRGYFVAILLSALVILSLPAWVALLLSFVGSVIV